MAPDRWTLYPGRSRLPDAASPDVRGRSYRIVAEVLLSGREDGGVLVAHGDRHAGYALRVEAGHLVHDYVHAGVASRHTSTGVAPLGRWILLELQVTRVGAAGKVRLLVDGRHAGAGLLPLLSRARIGYTGMDVGCDRGVTVGGYPAPARFNGRLRRVTVTAEHDQWLDPVRSWLIEGATG